MPQVPAIDPSPSAETALVLGGSWDVPNAYNWACNHTHNWGSLRKARKRGETTIRIMTAQSEVLTKSHEPPSSLAPPPSTQHGALTLGMLCLSCALKGAWPSPKGVDQPQAAARATAARAHQPIGARLEAGIEHHPAEEALVLGDCTWVVVKIMVPFRVP